MTQKDAVGIIEI